MLSAKSLIKKIDDDGDLRMEDTDPDDMAYYWEEVGEGDLEGLISGLTNDTEFMTSRLEMLQKEKILLVRLASPFGS
jgi:hypothetical protein